MSENDAPPFVAVFETVAYDKRRIITIAGNEPDAVWSEALDRKNAWGIEFGIGHAPRTSGLERSLHTPGWWSCTLIERAGDFDVCPCCGATQ